MDKFLSVRLRELRKIRNLKQKQVADLIHIHASMISAYENGLKNPSYNTLIKLSRLYGVTVDYLIGSETVKGDILSELKGKSRLMMIEVAETLIKYIPQEEDYD